MSPSRLVIVDDGVQDTARPQLPPGITWVPGAKPFVYARNVNRGVAACPEAQTIVIMGDDVEVLTASGFDRAHAFLRTLSGLGVLSAGIVGAVGNPRQQYDPTRLVRWESQWLAFVCVAIPRRVWRAIGPLDERFTGYGCEDIDYCWRVQAAGLGLAVLNEWLVRHDGSSPSSFRSRPDFSSLFAANSDRLHQKWGRSP